MGYAKWIQIKWHSTSEYDGDKLGFWVWAVSGREIIAVKTETINARADLRDSCISQAYLQ